MREKAAELQYLETLGNRAKITVEEKANLTAALQGFRGESTLDRYCRQVLGKQAQVSDDLYLSYQQQVCQLDKLVGVGRTLYLIEIKNYRGSYSFADGLWYCNGKVLAHNIFEQLNRAAGMLARILSDEHVPLTLKRVLVFIDPRAKIEIAQVPAGIMVKTLGETVEWFERLKYECTLPENDTTYPWQEVLARYQVPPYRAPNDFSSESGRLLKTGIRCPGCGGFDWEQRRYALRCRRCSLVEPKEQAFVRTICDYGVLYFKSDLHRGELAQFFGPGYSENYLKRILRLHFQPKGVSRSKNFCYENKGMEFQYWFSDQREYFYGLQRRIHWGKG